MPIRQLLATTAFILTVLTCANVRIGADQPVLNWPSQRIRLEIQRENTDSPVPTAITIRTGTSEYSVVGDDHLVRIRDRVSGELKRVHQTHFDWIRAAAYHPGGKTLFTAGDDRTIFVWNADNVYDFSRFAVEDRAILGLAIDPSGDRLATVGFNDRLYIYDLASRKKLHALPCPCEDMRAVAFSPDGSLLVTGGRSGILRVFDVTGGKRIADIHSHQKRIRDLVFAGNHRVISGSDDMTIVATDLARQRRTEIFRAPAKFHSIAYLGNDQLAAGSSDNLIRIINIPQRTLVGVLKGHQGTVCELAVDGKNLISGSFDTEIRIWEITNSLVNAPAVRVSQRPQQHFQKPTGSQPSASWKPAQGSFVPTEKRDAGSDNSFQIKK